MMSLLARATQIPRTPPTPQAKHEWCINTSHNGAGLSTAMRHLVTCPPGSTNVVHKCLNVVRKCLHDNDRFRLAALNFDLLSILRQIAILFQMTAGAN